MNTQAAISAITAFVIGFGGSITVALVALKGSTPDATTWILALILGAVTAAKDLRSLFKLPPVSTDDTKPNP